MKTILEQITDKIDSELKVAKDYKRMYPDYVYYEGKEVALNDLKTWIQNNIKEA